MNNFSKILTTPVLFLVFNRPEKTKRVFEVIRSVKPSKLYVAADAPRKNIPEDIEKCRAVIKIVKEIDWECDVNYLFHEQNVGCSLAGKMAWDWIFSREEEMIFLEDDGLISKSFFYLSQNLLNYYRYDKRIAYICGVNHGKKNGDGSYFYSRYFSGTYGMATWKRVYKLYDYSFESFPKIRKTKTYKATFLCHFEEIYRNRRFKKNFKNLENTYDLQIAFMLHKYNMYNIIPNINLVSNIGFDFEGTNTNVNITSKEAMMFGNKSRYEIDQIRHPEIFSIDMPFEKKYMLYRLFPGKTKLEVIIDVYFPLLGRFIRKFHKLCSE